MNFYDCKGGPGTTEPACGACVTCLHRVIEAKDAHITRLEEVAAKMANCARFLGTWNHDSMDVLRMKDEAMDELQNLEKEKP